MRGFAEALRKALRRDRSLVANGKQDMEVATLGTDVGRAGQQIPAEEAFAGNGVFVTPTPISANEDVQIWYSGLLCKNGVRQVFLHCGIGPGPWQNVQDVKMNEPSPGVFSYSLEAANGGRLEMCFHDGAGHWDNNNGRNWSYAIHNGFLH